jgi:hypothetical protein
VDGFYERSQFGICPLSVVSGSLSGSSIVAVSPNVSALAIAARSVRRDPLPRCHRALNTKIARTNPGPKLRERTRDQNCANEPRTKTARTNPRPKLRERTRGGIGCDFGWSREISGVNRTDPADRSSRISPGPSRFRSRHENCANEPEPGSPAKSLGRVRSGIPLTPPGLVKRLTTDTPSSTLFESGRRTPSAVSADGTRRVPATGKPGSFSRHVLETARRTRRANQRT